MSWCLFKNYLGESSQKNGYLVYSKSGMFFDYVAHLFQNFVFGQSYLDEEKQSEEYDYMER